MYQYTITQWLFFFYFYCFFGWVFESAYVSLKNRKFVNRGFMNGPFLPIYGTGAIMMLVVSMPFQDSILLTYLAGCVGATVLEFVTGAAMEALFKVRYWDYSSQKFNYKGYICLSSTIAWGFLTIFMTEILHTGVERMVLALPYSVISVITMVVTVYITADFTLSFKAAMDLRNVLIGLEKAKEEMERIQKRLDVIIAVVGDELETRRLEHYEKLDELKEEWQFHKSEYYERMDELKEGREMRKQERYQRVDDLMEELEEKFDRVKDRIRTEATAFAEDIKEELFELHSKYFLEKEHRTQFKKIKDISQRRLLKGNPGMRSVKFEEALEELKKAANEKNHKK
ncbi:MAG: hypothetical protein IJ409_04835 [Lachnospiraceae bacterium]|nr:hypothetical protein [Lachnospiraceae bacterium]